MESQREGCARSLTMAPDWGASQSLQAGPRHSCADLTRGQYAESLVTLALAQLGVSRG